MNYPFKIIETHKVPISGVPNAIYHVLPEASLEDRMRAILQQVDRSFPILNEDQQRIFSLKVPGIGGAGGIGGNCAINCARAGTLCMCIADNDGFDHSNIQRQAGSTYYNIGKSKALETARRIREITPHVELWIFPMGITPETVDFFISLSDIVLAETEIFEIATLIKQHHAALKKGITILDANSAGFGTHVFKFTGNSIGIEDFLEISLEDAATLDQKRRSGQMAVQDWEYLVDLVLNRMTPQLKRTHVREFDLMRSRMIAEGKAPILATNPPIASGILTQTMLLEIIPELRPEGCPKFPLAPGHLYIDTRIPEAKIIME